MGKAQHFGDHRSRVRALHSGGFGRCRFQDCHKAFTPRIALAALCHNEQGPSVATTNKPGHTPTQAKADDQRPRTTRPTRIRSTAIRFSNLVFANGSLKVSTVCGALSERPAEHAYCLLRPRSGQLPRLAVRAHARALGWSRTTCLGGRLRQSPCGDYSSGPGKSRRPIRSWRQRHAVFCGLHTVIRSASDATS